MDTCDQIWNRAAEVDLDGFTPHAGDLALRDVILFDGSVNNGGLINAVEMYAEDEEFPINTIIESFRTIGFDNVAKLIETAHAEWLKATKSDDNEALENLELALDPQYELDGENIEERLRELLASSPNIFASI